MDRQKETLAVALLLEQQHGENGPLYIAEQIGRLALKGDRAGVDRWRDIAAAFDSLAKAKSPVS